ncbi:MAG: DUF4244 domain-containing protein [Propionibacteriaceae bacterium]|jgi:Flp pilus assembly pilin Flp|nr:DUF4244 domain-containing protein [Propionibacteriaceae bacterium]
MNTLTARQRDDRGMTTAEYAVGTVASVSLVGVLISILGNEEFRKALWALVKVIFSYITKAIG